VSDQPRPGRTAVRAGHPLRLSPSPACENHLGVLEFRQVVECGCPLPLCNAYDIPSASSESKRTSDYSLLNFTVFTIFSHLKFCFLSRYPFSVQQ
jgi:hypothetical protein